MTTEDILEVKNIVDEKLAQYHSDGIERVEFNIINEIKTVYTEIRNIKNVIQEIKND